MEVEGGGKRERGGRRGRKEEEGGKKSTISVFGEGAKIPNQGVLVVRGSTEVERLVGSPRDGIDTSFVRCQLVCRNTDISKHII
jgi:hypothetical protein